MKLLLATQNMHKIREFRSMFRMMFRMMKGVDVYTLIDFPAYSAPEEVGETFEANATAKALHAAQELSMLTVADDSGLVVPSLNNRPGVKSRRYASEDATDQENRAKLLAEMASFNEEQRHAYYECSLAVASPQGLIKTFHGRCEGMILPEPRGSAGFGYDPLFLKHDYDKTFGELDETTKNRISHRRKAFEKLTTLLESLALKSNDLPH